MSHLDQKHGQKPDVNQDLNPSAPQSAAPGAPSSVQRNKRKPKRSIRLDRPHPRDFRLYNLAFFCEDCSHYDGNSGRCTMGFPAQHTREAQLKIYELTGGMAMCRALEID